MRIPPVAAFFILAVSSVPVGSGLFAAGPRSSVDSSPEVVVGVGDDSMPGYYPTWQSSQPAASGRVYGTPGDVAGYSRTGWPTGGVTMQYRPDLGTETAPIISPYLLRNNTLPDGRATVGHRVDDVLSPLVPQSALYYGEDGRTATSVNTNLGLYLERDIDIEASQIKAGPLFIHFTQLDAVALYSDISGPYAKELPDDGWIAAITLQFDMDLRLSPRTFFEVHGGVYYTPTNNSFGFYANSASTTYAHFEHTIEIDRWDITFYDYLDIITPLTYLLQYGSNGSAYDRSGLYAVGFLSNGFERSFDSQQLYFRNAIGVRASTFIKSDLRLTTGYEHYDMWFSKDLDYQGGLDHFNAGLFYEPKDLWFLPWGTYDAYFFENFRESLQEFYTGVTLPISRSLLGYARVGYAWSEGDRGEGTEDGTFVWDVGLQHKIDRQWSQSAVFGNSYRVSPLLETTHGMYSSYSLDFKSAYSTFYAGGNFTWAHIEPRGDYSSIYTAYTGINLDDLTSIRGTVIYAPTDFAIGDREVWLYRAELNRLLTPTLTLQLIYQLTDYHTTQKDGSYVDNMFMLTLSKKL